jgi:hypothetical protein
MNAQEFTQSCLKGDRILNNERGKEIVYLYSPDIVLKAVHFICDPFDNIVSRFHLAHDDFVRTNQTNKVLNSLPAKFVLAGTKLVLFGRYVLKFYIVIVQ